LEHHKVREILSDETLVTIMGTDFVGDGPRHKRIGSRKAPTRDRRPQHPPRCSSSNNQDLLVMNWHNHKLRVIDKADDRVHVLLGAAAGSPATAGAPTSAVNQPPHGDFDAQGNFFLIDQRNQRIA
jgi:hypothetical protein